MAISTSTVRSLRITSDQFIGLTRLLLEQPYSQETGEGFHVRDHDSSSLSAFYLFGVTTLEQSYDFALNELIKTKVTRVSAIPFELDSQLGCILTSGSLRNSNRVAEVLGRLTGYSITIDDVNLNIGSFLQRLRKSSLDVRITRIKLRQFPVILDLVADCNLSIRDTADGLDVIEKYQQHVTQVTFVAARSEDDQLPVTVQTSGRLTVYTDATFDNKIMATIKKAMLEGF